MCRQALAPLCKGCRSLEQCTRRILPVLYCQQPLSTEAGVLNGFVKYLERMYFRSNIDSIYIITPKSCSIKILHHTAKTLKEGGARVILVSSWSFFQNLLPNQNFMNILDSLCKIYIYVNSDGELLIASRILRSRPLSKFKDLVVLLRYVTNENEVKKALRSYKWRGNPKLCLIVPTQLTIGIEMILRSEGFRAVNEVNTLGLHGKGFLNELMEKFVEVVNGVEENISRNNTIIIHPLVIASEQTTQEDLVESGSEREFNKGIENSLLNDGVWEVEVKVRVDGTVVFDQELLNILKSILSSKTLTHTSSIMGLSYPKVKKKIELAEKALGVKLVYVERGGVLRGRSILTPEARRVLEIYEYIISSMKKELEKKLEELRKNIRWR